MDEQAWHSHCKESKLRALVDHGDVARIGWCPAKDCWILKFHFFEIPSFKPVFITSIGVIP